MNTNLYLQCIVNSAAQYHIELHSVVIYDEYISITTRNGAGMRAERGKPNNPIPDSEVMRAIKNMMDYISLSPVGDSRAAEWAALSNIQRYALHVAYIQYVNKATMNGEFASVLDELDQRGYLQPISHTESGLLTDYQLTEKGKLLVEIARL